MDASEMGKKGGRARSDALRAGKIEPPTGKGKRTRCAVCGEMCPSKRKAKAHCQHLKVEREIAEMTKEYGAQIERDIRMVDAMMAAAPAPCRCCGMAGDDCFCSGPICAKCGKCDNHCGCAEGGSNA